MHTREVEAKTTVKNKTDEGNKRVEYQVEETKEKKKDTSKTVECNNPELLRMQIEWQVNMLATLRKERMEGRKGLEEKIE